MHVGPCHQCSTGMQAGSGHVSHIMKGTTCVLPMQSNESGGHGAAASTTFCLVPEVVSAIAEHAAKSKAVPVPVLAAGGVTTGRQVRRHISVCSKACMCVAKFTSQ
jgi:hypothetical protein